MPERSSTSPKPRWLRPVLFALAVVFAAATILYTTLWMLGKRWAPDVDLGFDTSPFLVVTDVQRAGPAAKAGLRLGDRILAIDGTRLEGATSLYGLYKPHKPGDTVQLIIARPGQSSPVVLTAAFRQRLSRPEERAWTDSFAELLRNSYPVPFFLMGLVVLFLRLEDRRVWHLALLFASFIPGPGGVEFAVVPVALQPFALAYQTLAQGMGGPLFYGFFAVFPTRSPLDRRLPWLKWASLVTLPIGIFLALPGLHVGGLRLPSSFPSVYSIYVGCILGFVALGVVSLASNYFQATDPEARRKIRVIFWGTAIAFAPLLTVAASHFFVEYQDPGWLDAAVIVIAFLFPLSFAYAVVKHRVLEVPVLLKRSARYLFVQRGFTVLLALISIGATLIFASLFTRYLRPLMEVAQPAGIALGAVFGTLLLWGGSQFHRRVSARIDRAFFRSAYDARVILQNLAEKTRTVSGRRQLAELLDVQIEEALHPKSLACYLDRGDGNLVVESQPLSGEPDNPSAALPRPTFPFRSGAVFVPRELDSIPAMLPFLSEIAERGKTWEVPQGPWATAPESLAPDCLVPILGRDSRLIGLLVLGQRRSEEPYSSEDKHLLESVASQAGVALETIHLAEKMAERMQAELRTAREMEIAREVQARLLPQEPPRLETLDCAAQCLEARSVGGDYFDFLDLGTGHTGLVLADVSGKGVHAALLMANLQACLRSQSGITPLDPARLLQQVNRMLWKVTASEHFATLFFAIYDDATRQMVYVNCGHNAPLCLRQDGSVQRLPATATVIGLFEQWECAVEQIRLAPGDLLAVFSDGVTEAARNEEEYGEARLIQELRECRHLPANETVRAVLASVQGFSVGAQADDLTLLIAKAHI